MALKVTINESKEIEIWKEYKDQSGAVLAEFKIRGIDYKPYQVAIERAQNQVASKGYNVATASKEDKLYHELLLDAAACHLVADWKGVFFVEGDKEAEQPYTQENAIKLFNMGDIGIAIWAFIKEKSQEIQIEADAYKSDVLGKSSPSTNGKPSTETSQSTKKGKGKRSDSSK